jgi:hypothetical protein
MSTQDGIVYQTGWDSSAGPAAVLLTGIVYCWWLIIGGVMEILFGGIYLGSPQAAGFHVGSSQQALIYVLVGVWMVSLAFGILRLERWAYWGAWLMTLALATLSVYTIVHAIDGTNITLETLFFAGLNLLFCLYNIYFLLTPGTYKALHFGFLKGSKFSAGMALCGIALLLPSLALTLFVNHINKHLTSPVHILIYTLGFVLMTVMAFMGLRVKRWVWWACWAWAVILTGLSVDVFLRQHTLSSVDVEGVIFSVVNLVVVVTVAGYLINPQVREAVFHHHRKQALFSPRTLAGGVAIAVFALVIYLLPGQLGTLPIAYAVIGMVMGVVVGLLPGADPTNRIMGFVVGLLLAFASYVIRGGLLPYTNLSAAIVVTLMFLLITGITAMFRSRTWFVAMLLGAGTLYGLVEPLFQKAPSGYLAATGLAFAGILLGFGLGYTLSSLFELELVPYRGRGTEPDPALASHTTGASDSKGATATSAEPHDDAPRKAAA